MRYLLELLEEMNDGVFQFKTAKEAVEFASAKFRKDQKTIELRKNNRVFEVDTFAKGGRIFKLIGYTMIILSLYGLFNIFLSLMGL